MVSEAQRKATDKYYKAYIRRYVLNVNRKTEADIYKWLEAQGNVMGAIKDLIRKELENSK